MFHRTNQENTSWYSLIFLTVGEVSAVWSLHRCKETQAQYLIIYELQACHSQRDKIHYTMDSFKSGRWGLNFKETVSLSSRNPTQTQTQTDIYTIKHERGWVVLHKPTVSPSEQSMGLLSDPHSWEYYSSLCCPLSQSEPILTTWAQRHQVIRLGEPCFYIPAANRTKARHTTDPNRGLIPYTGGKMEKSEDNEHVKKK